ncbi:MAG TPA: nucleotidyltransferase family protein [Terriglobia bacterium]|nr:nucleotidyltransferase family protein [Terriglobia bacterium]
MNDAFAFEIARALSVRALPEDAQERLSRFSVGQWRRSLDWFHASGVALYFWQRMKSSDAQAVVPRNIQTVLENCLAMNRKRLEVMVEEFRSLNRAFRESGIQHAALKGFTLVPDYCPDPALRNQYDFDFLIPAESMALADRCLQDAGFVQKERSRCTHPVVYLAANRQTHPPVSLEDIYSPLIHRSLEVHTRLWEAEAEKISFELPANPLARAWERDWSGLKFHALSHEDALIFQVLHAFQHMLNNKCRLSIFLEIARFVQTHSADDVLWLKFAALLRGRRRLSEATAVVLSLAFCLFSPEIPAEVETLLGESLRPAMVMWVTLYGLRLALGNFSSSKDSLHLHRLFVEDPRLWAAVRRRKLYPVQRPTVPQRGHRGRFRARYKQIIHVARRIHFHVGSALHYVWELPAWKHAVQMSNRAGNTVSHNEALAGPKIPKAGALGFRR